VRKAAYWVMVASYTQIVAALLVVFLYLRGEDISTTIMLVVLVILVVAGNFLLMRNAKIILSTRQALNEQWINMTEILSSEAELNNKLRAQRHDFLNHMQIISSLVQLNEYDEAKKYVSKILGDIKQVGELLRTSNAAVNALLAAKSVDAGKQKVALKLHVSATLKDIPIEDWQFCRILSNLIDNAVYEAKKIEGEVHVSLREDDSALYFSVENDGGEISQEMLEKIFEPGYTTKGDDGTGMGLYIVKQTLEENNGTMDIESSKGRVRFFGCIMCDDKSEPENDV